MSLNNSEADGLAMKSLSSSRESERASCREYFRREFCLKERTSRYFVAATLFEANQNWKKKKKKTPAVEFGGVFAAFLSSCKLEARGQIEIRMKWGARAERRGKVGSMMQFVDTHSIVTR